MKYNSLACSFHNYNTVLIVKILEKNRLDTAFVQNLQHNYVKKIFHFVAELFYYVKMQPPKVFCKKKGS